MESLVIDLPLRFFKLGDVGQRNHAFIGTGDCGQGTQHVFLSAVFIDEFAFEIGRDLVEFQMFFNDLAIAYFALGFVIDKMQPGFDMLNFIFVKAGDMGKLRICWRLDSLGFRRPGVRRNTHKDKVRSIAE